MTSRLPGSRRCTWCALLLGLGAAAWAAAVFGASIGVWRYKSEPGARGDAPRSWPTASRLERSPARTALVVFVHPHCPCTSATLAELRRLASDRSRVEPIVVFVTPSGNLPGGHRAAAAAIPGIRVHEDDGGCEARLFGAMTSGHAVAYSPVGELLFEGGITTARGHVGENLVASRAITGGAPRGPPPSSTAVFGCPLESPR